MKNLLVNFEYEKQKHHKFLTKKKLKLLNIIFGTFFNILLNFQLIFLRGI